MTIPKWVSLNEGRASFLCALMIAVGPMSLALYTPALPALVAAFHVDDAHIKLTLSLYFLGFCLAQLICGPLSDAFGRRPVALWFFVLYLIGGAIALTSGQIWVLLIGRALQGIGAAAGVAVSRALVRDLFVGQTSARVMNRIGLMVAVVPALAPAVGALILSVSHWRALFGVMFGYALILLACAAFLLPETNRAPDRALIEPKRVISNYRLLLGDRRFLAPASLMALTLTGIYTMPSLTPFVLIGELGFNSLQFAGAMLVPTGTLLLSNLIVGRLLRRIDADRLIPYGVGLIALAGLGFASIFLQSRVSWFAVIGPAAVWTLGLPLVSPGATTMALSPFPKIAGAAAALIGFMQMAGGFCGSALAAAFFKDATVALSVMPPIIAGAAALAALAIPRATDAKA